MLRNFLCCRWRKASKYKKVLQQLQSHLKQLKNKKQAVSRILRDDITQLIRNNDQTRALARTKELLTVENSISVYGLMLQFTDVILVKFNHSIRNQRFGKELLDEKINEAVSSLVFASTRCGEELLQPLLLSMREIFGQRYGQLYVSNALELRQGNFVNLKITEILSKESGSEIGLQDMLTVEYHTHEIEKHVIYVEEEKSEFKEETSMEDENIENAQKEEEEDEEENKVEEEKERRPKHVHPKLPDYDQIVAKLIRAKNTDEKEIRRRRLLPKHVHPKLPDYDQIVDNFNALRT